MSVTRWFDGTSRRRIAPRVVAAVTVLGVGLATAALVLGWGDSDELWLLLPTVVMTLVGGWLSVHRPGNLVGAVMQVGGLSWITYQFAREWALASTATDPLPGAYLAAWAGAWVGAPIWASLGALLLVFPDGRLSGWRRWALLPIGVLAGCIVVGAVSLWGVPIEILTLPNPEDVLPEYAWIDTAFLLGMLLMIPLGIVSLAVRFVRGSADLRRQIMWPLIPGSVFLLAFLSTESAGLEGWQEILFLALPLTLVPVSIGVAVVRYRLYDIDRIASRTVAYSIVVGVLIAIYAGSVALLTQVLPGTSDLAVAASTLAAAALFTPVRRRVVGWVDRRFHRTRYRAEQELDEFTARLRDGVDIDGVQADLIAAIQRTLEPSTVGVWIRSRAG